MTRTDNVMSPSVGAEGKRETLRRVLLSAVLPILILSIGVGTVIYYIAGPAEGYMTSDCTDSLRWAYETYASGRLISDNFYYAAILPFGGNLIFLPYIALFGYSMTAQVLGLCTYALLLAAAAYYMTRGLGLSRIASASCVSLLFLVMSSSAKLREIMWEHIFYYNLGILFFCLGFGLAARLVREGSVLTDRRGTRGNLLELAVFVPVVLALLVAVALCMRTVAALTVALLLLACATVAYLIFVWRASKRKADKAPELLRSREWLRLGALLVFSLLAATDGLQTLVCFTLPIFGGIVAERLTDVETPFFSRKNLRIFSAFTAFAAVSAVGYLLIDYVSGGVSAGYADAYSSYSAMSSWKNNFLGFFDNWFSLLGVSVAERDPLVSLDSIVNMIRIAGAFLLLVAPIVLLFFYGKIESRGVRAALIGHFAVSAFILFAVTFGRLGGANWRLTPMLGTSVILSAVTAFELIRQRGLARRIGSLVLGGLILVSAVSFTTVAAMPADYGRDNVWHLCADELEARGLTYGYANFWWAESITMFSDGKVQTVNISESTSSPTAYAYQVPKDSFGDQEGVDKYFLLLTADEYAPGAKTMFDWISRRRSNGEIVEEFIIETEEYSLRGHSGDKIYVFVFDHSLVDA